MAARSLPCRSYKTSSQLYKLTTQVSRKSLDLFCRSLLCVLTFSLSFRHRLSFPPFHSLKTLTLTFSVKIKIYELRDNKQFLEKPSSPNSRLNIKQYTELTSSERFVQKHIKI